MEIETKIKLVQMNKHKTHMNISKLIKESKFSVDGQMSKPMWNQQEVGEYAGPGRTTPTKLLLKHPYDIRLTEVVLRNPVKSEKLNLLTGFSNCCPCGKTGLTNKEFKRHSSWNMTDMHYPTVSYIGRFWLIGWISTLTKRKYSVLLYPYSES